MLQPKKTKFRKMHKGRIHGEAKGGTLVSFGTYGLKATEPERITARQIEAARRAMTRHMKRQGRVWIRVFPDLPVTSKPGRVMFEIDGVTDSVAREALRLAAMKLPIKTRVVIREDW
jgi:large subunit ribosomal protein L16